MRSLIASPLASALDRLSQTWFRSKIFLEHMVGFSHDALHVLVGVCLQLLIAALLRTSLRSPWPWFMVLILELANEWSDLHHEVWPDRAMQRGESAKDILLTMALPTLLLLMARRWPELLGKSDDEAAHKEQGESQG